MSTSLESSYKIGLVQVGDSFGGQYYLPYSVGVLQAYAQANLSSSQKFDFLSPIYKRESIQKIVAGFKNASAVFYSTYIWNFHFSLEIARLNKAANPHCLNIFGGPQVPCRPDGLESFVRRYPFIDLCCYGEGEVPFLKILEKLDDRSWQNVPSVGYVDSAKNFIMAAPAQRIIDINVIPSPYLQDTFAKLMRNNPDEQWSALWETNRGCPFTCAYCTWGAFQDSKVYSYDVDRVYQEIDWFSRHKIEFVFCCDANYGIFRDRDLRIAERVAANKRLYGYPQAFSVQSTKNATETIFRLNKILDDNGLQRGVNLALQSVNDETLKDIRRSNISMKTYSDLQKMFTEAGIPTFSDMIIGLPNETYDSFTKGVDSVISEGQHNRIQFINLTMLENSEMSDPQYQEKYGMVLQECKMVSHHTTLQSESTVDEIESLVIATNAMPKDDWVKTRVFCWMTSLLHFDKLMQIPFIVLNQIMSMGYKEMVDSFVQANTNTPVLYDIVKLFEDKAHSIQNGECEYVPSKEWLNVWWPVDEHVFIKLCQEDKLSQFYDEAKQVLANHILVNNESAVGSILYEAIEANGRLIRRPFIEQDYEITLRSNILEIYKNALIGKKTPYARGEYRYKVLGANKWQSWDDWCRDVVWHGTKRGAYMNDFVHLSGKNN